MRTFKERTEYCSVKYRAWKLSNLLCEAIVVSFHNICFSDKILFLQARFKVTQHFELQRNNRILLS